MEGEIQLNYQRKKDNITNLKALHDKHKDKDAQTATKKKKKNSSRRKCSPNSNGEENPLEKAQTNLILATEQNNTEQITKLLEEIKSLNGNLNFRDKEGLTLLHKAISSKQF
jgi:hypothetical protein